MIFLGKKNQFITGSLELTNGQCMVDSSDRLLPTYLGSKSTMTPQLCTEMCGVREYSFAGVNYGSECWCGNDEPPRSKFAIAADCNMECPGDRTQKCGGGWRMNVYKTNTGKERITKTQFRSVKTINVRYSGTFSLNILM